MLRISLSPTPFGVDVGGGVREPDQFGVRDRHEKYRIVVAELCFESVRTVPLLERDVLLPFGEKVVGFVPRRTNDTANVAHVVHRRRSDFHTD